MAFTNSVHAKAVELIKLAVEMTTAAGSGHPTSAASLAHLTTVLMYHHLRHDPAKPDHPQADRLVLSEGHACPIVYAAAADLGIRIDTRDGSRPMTREDALQLREIDSPIDGHPNPAEGFPFFPAATGSLGQGLSIAAGMALAARLDELDKRIYCLIGDGESREGQIWEAIDFIHDYRLNAVCPIFNCNREGQSDPVSPQQSPEITRGRLEAAGFEVRLIEGHDPEQILEALQRHVQCAENPPSIPFAIVAQTQKGWGFNSVMKEDVHGKAVSEEDLEQALAALEEKAKEVGAAWDSTDLKIPEVPQRSMPELPEETDVPAFPEALQRAGKGEVLDEGKLAPRKAYGIALKMLGHRNRQIVALDGDVKNSTYSEFFAKDDELSERFFESHIAEQNMISVAGGLCVGGKIPFVSSFGKFLMRGYDQLELGLISRFPLKLMGSHVGVSLASDGPSQMALPDVAFFHAWTTVRDENDTPVLYLLNPSDAYSAYALTVAMAEHPGACYLRTMRPDVPFLYDADTPFTLGGHQVVTEGSDLVIFATGYLVHEALKALHSLQEQDVKPTLVDLYSLPFDREAIVHLVRENQGNVLTVEDNYGAGFGSAIADALAEAGEPFSILRQMHVRRIPKSGRTPDDVLGYLGLAADDIVRTVQQSFLAVPS